MMTFRNIFLLGLLALSVSWYSYPQDEYSLRVEDCMVVMCIAEDTMISVESYFLPELLAQNGKLLSKRQRNNNVFLQIDMTDDELDDLHVKWADDSSGTMIVQTGRSSISYEFGIFDIFDFCQEDLDEIIGMCLEGVVENLKSHEAFNDERISSMSIDLPFECESRRCTFYYDRSVSGCCCIILPKYVLDVPLHVSGRLSNQEAQDYGVIRRSEFIENQREAVAPTSEVPVEHKGEDADISGESSWWSYLKNSPKKLLACCGKIINVPFKMIAYYLGAQ
jgi:hypothetical protein